MVYIKLSCCQDLRRQRQAVQTAQKEIESLSFNMKVIRKLQKKYCGRFTVTPVKYGKCIQRDKGLVLYPKATNSTDKYHQLKQKYKQLNQWISIFTNHYQKNWEGDLEWMFLTITESEQKQL